MINTVLFKKIYNHSKLPEQDVLHYITANMTKNCILRFCTGQKKKSSES